MLALIQDTTILHTVRPNGWFELPDGSRASPAHDGWNDGTYRLATIQPAAPVPEGKRVVSTRTELIDGEPRYVNVTEDIDRSSEINNERARRIVAGTVIGDVYVTGRDEDTRNLMGLALAAQMRLATGDDETITVFRDGDNVDHELTPSQVIGLWQQSAAYVSHLYAKSWEIKDMDPLPDDITENSLWT